MFWKFYSVLERIWSQIKLFTTLLYFLYLLSRAPGQPLILNSTKVSSNSPVPERYILHNISVIAKHLVKLQETTKNILKGYFKNDYLLNYTPSPHHLKYSAYKICPGLPNLEKKKFPCNLPFSKCIFYNNPAAVFFFLVPFPNKMYSIFNNPFTCRFTGHC